MLLFEWDEGKDAILRAKRGISFEDIEHALTSGGLRADIPHPNQKVYPHQRIFVVSMGDYMYIVPYVMNGETYFLKTAFPNRRYTKKYLRD